MHVVMNIIRFPFCSVWQKLLLYILNICSILRLMWNWKFLLFGKKKSATCLIIIHITIKHVLNIILLFKDLIDSFEKPVFLSCLTQSVSILTSKVLICFLTLEVGSPSFAAKSWSIYTTSWTRDASWDTEKWNEKTWSLACLWSLAGKICYQILVTIDKYQYISLRIIMIVW